MTKTATVVVLEMRNLMKIMFLGTDKFAIPSLEKLAEVHEVTVVVTRPDKPRGRGKVVSPTPVKEAAERLGIPVLEPLNLKGSKFREEIAKFEFDIAIIVAYGRLIPSDFLDAPLHGFICLHPSMLPEYRGCSPIECAIKDGKEKTGISVFYLSSEFDTGDIIFQEEKIIEPNETGGSLRERFSHESPDSILKALECIEDGDSCPYRQDDSKSCYAPKICVEDAEIKWNNSASNIHNMIRAYNPKPGAFSLFHGKKLKIFMSEILTDQSGKPPGTIIQLQKNRGFVVACNPDSLLLTEIQPEGKKAMNAWSYVVGHHLQVDEVMGL